MFSDRLMKEKSTVRMEGENKMKEIERIEDIRKRRVEIRKFLQKELEGEVGKDRKKTKEDKEGIEKEEVRRRELEVKVEGERMNKEREDLKAWLEEDEGRMTKEDKEILERHGREMQEWKEKIKKKIKEVGESSEMKRILKEGCMREDEWREGLRRDRERIKILLEMEKGTEMESKVEEEMKEQGEEAGKEIKLRKEKFKAEMRVEESNITKEEREIMERHAKEVQEWKKQVRKRIEEIWDSLEVRWLMEKERWTEEEWSESLRRDREIIKAFLSEEERGAMMELREERRMTEDIDIQEGQERRTMRKKEIKEYLRIDESTLTKEEKEEVERFESEMTKWKKGVSRKIREIGESLESRKRMEKGYKSEDERREVMRRDLDKILRLLKEDGGNQKKMEGRMEVVEGIKKRKDREEGKEGIDNVGSEEMEVQEDTMKVKSKDKKEGLEKMEEREAWKGRRVYVEKGGKRMMLEGNEQLREVINSNWARWRERHRERMEREALERKKNEEGREEEKEKEQKDVEKMKEEESTGVENKGKEEDRGKEEDEIMIIYDSGKRGREESMMEKGKKRRGSMLKAGIEEGILVIGREDVEEEERKKRERSRLRREIERKKEMTKRKEMRRKAELDEELIKDMEKILEKDKEENKKQEGENEVTEGLEGRDRATMYGSEVEFQCMVDEGLVREMENLLKEGISTDEGGRKEEEDKGRKVEEGKEQGRNRGGVEERMKALGGLVEVIGREVKGIYKNMKGEDKRKWTGVWRGLHEMEGILQEVKQKVREENQGRMMKEGNGRKEQGENRGKWPMIRFEKVPEKINRRRFVEDLTKEWTGREGEVGKIEVRKVLKRGKLEESNWVCKVPHELFEEMMARRCKEVTLGGRQVRYKEYVEVVICFICQGYGHISSSCPNRWKGMRCRRCGEWGHGERECQRKVAYCQDCGEPGHKMGTDGCWLFRKLLEGGRRKEGGF